VSRARPSASSWAKGLKKAGAEAAVITAADSVCWLLNIRGHDVPHTPFTLAFAILHDDGGADLFLDPAKRNPELMAHLGNSVQVHSPEQFTSRTGCPERQKRAGGPDHRRGGDF
jgi:Xaa-Pro aminopeptidase